MCVRAVGEFAKLQWCSVRSKTDERTAEAASDDEAKAVSRAELAGDQQFGGVLDVRT